MPWDYEMAILPGYERVRFIQPHPSNLHHPFSRRHSDFLRHIYQAGLYVEIYPDLSTLITTQKPISQA